MSERPTRLDRTAFRTFRPIQTRWLDNDAYGHINNTVYYGYFDTVVNAYLVEHGLLEINGTGAIGLVVETGCVFFESAEFPQVLEAGLRIVNLGRSSVRYSIGIFREGGEATIALGHFVHVYVDRDTRRPVEIPAHVREALAPLL